MAVLKFEVKTKNGTYKDRNGEEKTKWHQMGVCFENDKGQLSMKIDSIPVGFDGWVSLFEPKPKEPSAGKSSSNNAGNSIQDDDIPF